MSSIAGCDTERASSKTPRGAAPFERPYRALSARFQVILILALLLCSFVPARAEPLRVLAFGDSLTAGFLLPADAAFPAQLERRLRADGFDATVINAGVSGETTAEGLARADFALGEGADLVILELGANDMLRGVDPKVTSANLDKIVTAIEARKAAVVLAGMVASGNFGPDYKARFDAVFPDLAARRGLPIYPFFLSGVAGDKALVLPDGLHPNADGAARIAGGIAPLVEQSLARLKNARERQIPH
jgi:acyl-CoA thioesterase I